MNTIHSRIKWLRLKNGLTQSEVGEAIGVTDVAVSRWEIGLTSPRGKSISKLADYFHVTSEWLKFGTSDNVLKSITKVPFHVFNGVSITEFDGVTYIPVITEHVKNVSSLSNLICFELCDDSMSPLIREGAILTCDTGSKIIKDGNLYAFIVNDVIQVRRLFKTLHGMRAVSFNNDFFDEEFEHNLNLTVIGRIVCYSSLA
ncbi:TPA: XRE family transcriptional regulator [Photobacterium damselae]